MSEQIVEAIKKHIQSRSAPEHQLTIKQDIGTIKNEIAPATWFVYKHDKISIPILLQFFTDSKVTIYQAYDNPIQLSIADPDFLNKLDQTIDLAIHTGKLLHQ